MGRDDTGSNGVAKGHFHSQNQPWRSEAISCSAEICWLSSQGEIVQESLIIYRLFRIYDCFHPDTVRCSLWGEIQIDCKIKDLGRTLDTLWGPAVLEQFDKEEDLRKNQGWQSERTERLTDRQNREVGQWSLFLTWPNRGPPWTLCLVVPGGADE